MTIAINLANYGDISDISSLTDKIRLWLDRGSDLDAYIPTFISLAEAYLNRELRTPEMEALTPVSGTTFQLPADYLALRNLTVAGRALDATSPAVLANEFGNMVGFPTCYAISGRSITIAPSPAQTPAPAMLLEYWQRIPALSAANPSNWLLVGHPDVYLFGALAQAEAYIENPERAAQWASVFDAAVESLKVSSAKARWGGPLVARASVRENAQGTVLRNYVSAASLPSSSPTVPTVPAPTPTADQWDSTQW